MEFRIYLLLFFLISFATDYSNARRISFGGSRGTSRGSVSRGRAPTSFGHSSSSSGSHTASHPSAPPTSFGHPPSSSGSHTSSHPSAPPTSFGHPPSSSGSHTSSHPSAPPTSFGHPPSPSGTHTSSHPTGSQIGFGTGNRQPSAPHLPVSEHVPKINSNNVQSQNPGSPFGQHNNQPYTPGMANPPWSNPHLNTPGGSPPSIGFKPEVFPSRNSNPSPGGFPIHPQNSAPVNHPHPPPTSFHPSAPYVPHINHPSQGIPSPHYANSHPNPYPGVHSTSPLGNPYAVHPTSTGYGHYGNGYGPVGAGQPYYPQQPHILSQPASQPFIPGQTVIMVPGQQDSGRGFGQILKEAVVFSTVNAGVNRLLNPHTYHHHYESKPDTPASSGDTHITYNINYPGANGANIPQGIPGQPGYIPTPDTNGNSANYPYPPVLTPPTSPAYRIVPTTHYNRPQSSTPGSSGGVTTNNTSSQTGGINNNTNVPPYTLQYKITDDELRNLTEELYGKEEYNVSKYITLNVQGRWTSGNVTDLASGPLLYVEQHVYEYPTIKAMRALYDNYERNSTVKESRTPEKRMEENLLLDMLLNTNVLSRTMQWLSDRGFIDPDDFERKDILRHIWFHQFSGSTSGFERIFTSEIYGTDILGVQDWLYFDYEESRRTLDYMGYVDKVNFGNGGSLLKLNFQMDGIIRPNATIFVGTMPELEISLYTICFFARPNDLCPISLGGTKFNIYTHSFRYYGKDLIDLGFPFF